MAFYRQEQIENDEHDATAHAKRVEIVDTSGNSGSVITGDAGQSADLVAGNRKEVAFTTTTVQAVASTDVSNYRWASVQITSQGTSSTVTFQVSNDNSTWVSLPLMVSTSTNALASTSTTSTGVWYGAIPGRYFRLNVTGISAGTTAGTVEFFSLAAHLNTLANTQATVGAAHPSSVSSQGGSDGTNTTRIKTDTIANLIMNLSPQAVGGWSKYLANAVTTAATVSVAAGKFGGYALINLNSAPAYLQCFDTTGAVTLGTTVPDFVIPLPANSTAANGVGANVEVANGVSLTNGLKVAATTTATGSTTVSTGVTGNIWYK